MAAALCLLLLGVAGACCLLVLLWGGLVQRQLSGALDARALTGRMSPRQVYILLRVCKLLLYPVWRHVVQVLARRCERRQREAKRAWNARSHEKRPVCFLGDEEFANWTSLVMDMTIPDSLLQPLYGCINCGLCGASSHDLLVHCETIALVHLPRVVVLHIGGNDYDSHPCSDIESVVADVLVHTLALVDKCYQYGVRDVRLMLAPIPNVYGKCKRQYMQLLHTKLALLCDKYGVCDDGLRVSLLDLRPQLESEYTRSDELETSAYLNDGVQKTLHGHRLRGDLLRAALA